MQMLFEVCGFFRHKKKYAFSFERYKYRFVDNGANKQPSVDYGETYALSSNQQIFTWY